MRDKSRATSCCLCRCLCLCQTQIWCDRHPLIRGSEIVCQINNQIKSPSSSPFSSPSQFHHHHHHIVDPLPTDLLSVEFPRKATFRLLTRKVALEESFGSLLWRRNSAIDPGSRVPPPSYKYFDTGPNFWKGLCNASADAWLKIKLSNWENVGNNP